MDLLITGEFTQHLLTMAKKVAWIVLAVGWGFILIRILMVIFGK